MKGGGAFMPLALLLQSLAQPLNYLSVTLCEFLDCTIQAFKINIGPYLSPFFHIHLPFFISFEPWVWLLLLFYNL